MTPRPPARLSREATRHRAAGAPLPPALRADPSRPVAGRGRLRRAALRLAAALSVALTPVAASGQASGGDTLRLARIFGDGMVVQRGEPIAVWGWAAPGAEVRVEMEGRTGRAVAGADGAWRASLPALPAGGPYAMEVRSGTARIALMDVLVGDVWIGSGQSNMALTVGEGRDAEREIAAAADTRIRVFTVPTSWAEAPAADLAGGRWVPADRAHVADVSAVAYFFARDLRAATGVPVGVVVTAWGGANIETWTSRGTLGLDDRAWRAVLAAERARGDSLRDALLRRLGSLPETDAGTAGGGAPWADPALDDAGWREIAVPTVWERQGYGGLDGVGWYRTAFTLSPAEAAGPVTLRLGRVDDADVTWVNGVEVGRTNGYDRARVYTLPPGAARAGRNVVAVRVEDGGGDGGIHGAPETVHLETAAGRRPFPGPWRFRVGVAAFRADGQRINKVPTLVYNRMLHPLLGLPATGVLWYQGESNANDAAQAAAYRAQFAAMIAGWRREWGRELPFLWAQLPNFGDPDAEPPARPAWALLRESQAAALALPRTGQAVTIDVGEAGDIHPRNKQDVGRRLALVARRVVHGEDVAASGPVFRRATFGGGRAVVEFDHASGGLVARGGEALGGFAVAGADGRFAWAEARVDGERVVVWSERVPEPVAVRYAWSNGPVGLGLYNREGLPAAPFRTDDW